jgi:hypothetical protein
MKRYMSKVMFLIFLSIISVACSETHPQHSDAHHAPNGDLRETTSSVDILPTFLDDQQSVIRDAYLIAAQHPDVLDWIPCNCGCGMSAGHQSSKQCFIHQINDDGTIVWDDHGSRCDLCINIAVESVLLHKQGFSLKEIRNKIDTTYSKDYAPPTPTPMPEK